MDFVYSVINFLFATATVAAPVMCTSRVTSYALGPVHSGQHCIMRAMLHNKHKYNKYKYDKLNSIMRANAVGKTILCVHRNASNELLKTKY